MRIKRAIISAALVLCCAASCLITAFAAGSVTITCGAGGSIANITGNATIKDSVIHVNDDGPVSFDIVPDDEFRIESVMMNGQSMGAGYTGASAKTVTLSPKGADIQIEVVFVKTTGAIPGAAQDKPETTPDSESDKSSETLPEASSASEESLDTQVQPETETPPEAALDATETPPLTTTPTQSTPSDSLGAAKTDDDGIGDLSDNVEKESRDWSKLGLYASIVVAAIGSAAAVIYFVKKRID